MIADTLTARRPTATATARPPLLSRALLLRFLSILGASTSFYLLLSVVPLYADTAGGQAAGHAGAVTGALMASTVVGELATARLVARLGYRVVLALGLVLLGAPALLLGMTHSLIGITAVCLVRGFGFALCVVAGGALTAELIPAQRRAEGLALVGLVSGGAALVASPLGIVIAEHAGFEAAFGIGALSAVAVVPTVLGLPRRDREARSDQQMAGIVGALRSPALTGPAARFATVTMATGVVVTFLPVALGPRRAGLVAAALLVQNACAIVGRLAAARLAARTARTERLSLPVGVAVAAIGMLLLAVQALPAAVVAGSVLFGLGFGAVQNTSLARMYAAVDRAAFGAVSGLWNLAYDAGMGAGAAGVGLVAAHTGYPTAFALTAVPMLLAIRTSRRPTRPTGPAPTTR